MRLTLLAAIPVVLISGCGELSQKISDRIAESSTKTSQLVKEVGQVDTTATQAPPVMHESGIWIAKTSIKLEKQDQLPPIFSESATFDRAVYSLAEFAERLTLRSGIPTKVAPEAAIISQQALQSTGTTQPYAAGAGQPQSGGVPPAPSSNLSNVGPLRGAANLPVRISYSGGNLKGLLDTAVARFGVFWKYVNGTILLYYTDTRTFQINAIPGDAALNATVTSGSTSTSSNGASAGSASGASSGSSTGISSTNSQNTAVTSQLSVYTDIAKSIGSMLSIYGKTVTSPATGTITVTDTPDNLERVSKFIDGVNKSLSRQVMINVTVLSVTLSRDDSFGINWNIIYSDLLHNYGIQNTAASEPGSTAFSAGILNTANSKFAGSSLVINALSSQGQVRRETTASVVTLNNQPVPVQVATQTSYLQSSQTTLAGLGGAATSLTPGTITSGFNMTILPHVLEDGTVMLQFSTDMSSLRGIRTVTSNGSSIETPELDTRNFLQRVAMKSNETLIISGFEQTNDNLDHQGVGHPDNILLGGSRKAQTSKEAIVILITPIAAAHGGQAE